VDIVADGMFAPKKKGGKNAARGVSVFQALTQVKANHKDIYGHASCYHADIYVKGL
jgi:hypothetical protein